MTQNIIEKYSNIKLLKFKNVPTSKMTQIKKWPKFKSDPNSKVTQIKKWPKLKKHTKFKNRPNIQTAKFKNEPN